MFHEPGITVNKWQLAGVLGLGFSWGLPAFAEFPPEGAVADPNNPKIAIITSEGNAPNGARAYRILRYYYYDCPEKKWVLVHFHWEGLKPGFFNKDEFIPIETPEKQKDYRPPSSLPSGPPPGANVDLSDPTHAYDPKTKQNFFYDEDKKAWVNGKTGKVASSPKLCPDDCPKTTTPPPEKPKIKESPKTTETPKAPETPKTPDSGGTGMAPPGTSKTYEVSLGYAFVRADEDGDKLNLNGWRTTFKFNFDPNWGAVAALSGTYGSKDGFDLTRYQFLVGPEYTLPIDDQVSLFANVLAGIDRDKNTLGDFSQSTNAFAGDVGAGVAYRFTEDLSVKVQGDYLPTRFSSNWQSSFGASANLAWGFGQP